MPKERVIKETKSRVASIEAKLIDENERLKRQVSRISTQNEILRATTTSSINGSYDSSFGLSVPTSSIENAGLQSLRFPMLRSPSPRSRSSESQAVTDLEPGSRSIPQELSNSLSSANSIPVHESTAFIRPAVAQEQQQPLHEIHPRPSFRSSMINTMDVAFLRQITEFGSFSPPTQALFSSSIDVSNKSSNPHRAGSCEPNRPELSKRKRENFEFIFDSRPTEPNDGEQQVKRGRRGPLSTNTKERQKAIKSLGGACWRCRILKKPCDDHSKCSNCESINSEASVWAEIGCRRGSLNDSLRGEKGDYIILLQKHIAILQDHLSQISKMKYRHKEGTIREIVNAITKKADSIQYHTTAVSSVEAAQHFLYDSKNFDNQITSLFEHCNCSQFYSAASMTAALTALSECCPDILRSNGTVLLALVLNISEIMGDLRFHFKWCVRDEPVAEIFNYLGSGYRDPQSAILYHLIDGLEPFIFRKKRWDLQFFCVWFLILFIVNHCTGLRLIHQALFVASTQGVLNSSQARYKKERDTVEELITRLTSEIVFDELGKTKYKRGLFFVSRMAGVSPYDPISRERTILKSSVLSHLPEESRVSLKYMQWLDSDLD